MRQRCLIQIAVLSIMIAGAPCSNGASNAEWKHRTYSTNFAHAEDPISEHGNWINGHEKGLDWANVRNARGLAFGTEAGSVKYDDSTALLTGPWGPDQSAEATVHTVNQNEHLFEEVEIRLRSALAPHRATGYEVNFRCLQSREAYTQIVRWDGPLGKFTYVVTTGGAQCAIADGSKVKAAISGNVITAYIDGKKILQASDDTFKTGSPGMGFYLEGGSGTSTDYGFTRFTAWD